MKTHFEDFEKIFSLRIAEADEFYSDIQKNLANEEFKNIQRQAYAGMIWCKQFYDYNVEKWLKGDPSGPPRQQSEKRAETMTGVT